MSNSFLKIDRQRWDKLGNYCAVLIAIAIPISTFMTSVLMILIMLAWILGDNFSNKRAILFKHPLVRWIYPIVVLTFVGMLYSYGQSNEIRRGMSDGLRLVFIPILIYFYQNQKVRKFALWAFAFAMILTLLFAFLKVYGHFPIGLKYTTGAVFKSHIKTSFFMAMAAFFLALHVKESPHYRWGLIVLIGLMIYYLLFMSVGRVGYMALVIGCLFSAWQWYRFKGLMVSIFLAIGMIAMAYMTSDIFSQRINLLAQDIEFYQQGGRLGESSLGSRLEFAITSAKLIQAKPLFGWGTGGFGVAYAKAHEGESTLLTDNPHNEYLRFGVELGMLGLVLLLLLFYQQWRLSGRLPPETKMFFQGVLLIFVVGCFLNSWVKDFAEAYYFCMMSAICFGSLAFESKDKCIDESKKVRSIVEH